MKPLRIFIFFFTVLLLLLLLSFLFPKQGIGIGGDLRLSFVSLPELIREDSTTNSSDVELMLAASSVTDDPESDPGVDLFPGSVEEAEASRPRVIPANVESL